MNEIIKALYSRKSVRVFTDQPVSQKEKELILNAALQAPSAGCQLLYTILDITDQSKKERLSFLCDHQAFIANAPVVLIFCADCRKWLSFYREAGLIPRDPGPGDLFLSIEDALIAAQNTVTAAQSLGLGSCYIGDIMENYEKQRRLLNLPDYVFPAVMLVFGWPTQQQKNRPKPQRCAQEHIVHENTYRSMDDTELREMLSHQYKNSTFEDWCKAFCKRKYNSDFSKEMTRSVGEYLKQFE